MSATGLLLAFVVAVSWLSAAAGLLAKTPYPSSAFVPIDTMPTWLHAFADHQPVGSTPWTALAWCGGILAVATAMSGTLFRTRTA